MATSTKKNAKKTIKKNIAKKNPPVKKAIGPKKSTPTKKTTSVKKNLAGNLIAALRPAARVLYIDASFFFPPGNGAYTDNYQDGRVSNNGTLIAPILLRVGSIMKTITIYYKNNSSEDLTVWILKHHIDHHAYSGEVEVSYEACPPGISAPDNFLQKVIDHFDAGGKILDKYMYHIEISSTIKTASEERMLRGIRIAYTEPA